MLFFQAEDGIRDLIVTGVQTCALPIYGQASTPSDLNRDGFVNLIDFSIMIFWWQTNGGDSDPPADINGNGSVSL